jgi:hypothetical protein
MFGDPRQHVGEPGLRINIVHLGRDDQTVHESGSLAAAIRAAEHPGFPAQSDRADGALDGVVVELDAALIDKALKPSQRDRA